LAKTTTRAHILAKELGVTSKAIVAKCQAEGLDVKNHMSTISAGLAATIREWFSEGEHTTTVETTEKVDLKKVRVRKKRKKAVKKDETATQPKPKPRPKSRPKLRPKPKPKLKLKPKPRPKPSPRSSLSRS